MLATLRATGALALHGGAFASPNWLYWLDYATYPLLVIWLATIDCRSFGWVAAAFAGLVLFTFVEYWAHRLTRAGCAGAAVCRETAVHAGAVHRRADRGFQEEVNVQRPAQASLACGG